MKCETTALGDSAASGRFRIFKEGKIRTDYGLSIMNPSAGREVIRAFRDRGNDMMIDLRHFSIAKNATREQSEALGWIKCPNGLEYVDGDGLYAVNVEWTSEVLAGLKSTPPKWKYFSPLYDQDAKTKVITSLSNVALTNMPATHGLNRLAAERGTGMNDLKLAGECLLMLMALAEGGDEKAIAARDKMIALLGDNAQAAIDAANASDAAPESVSAEDMAMSESDKAIMASMDEEQKATYMAGMKMRASNVAAESDKKDVAAESDKKEVAAESDKKEDISAEKSETVTAEMLLLMADGELAKSKSNRETIVAELRSKKLIAAGGSTEKLLLSADTSDKAFAEFVSARKSKTVTIGGPAVKKIPQLAPAAKSTVTVSAEARTNTERLSAKLGTDPKKVLAKLVELG
jgi:phage I-like protein